jgi:alkyldihydroxyacetonephosphate synthase
MERARSHWGWGFADRFPATAERAALGRQIGALLGITPSPTAPVPIDAITLRPARIAPPSRLAGITTADAEARIRHTYGKSYLDQLRGFGGDFAAAPDLVARPTSEAEVEALLAWAAERRVAVVPFGGGTSVVGGVECGGECGGEGFAGVLCLDVRGLDRVRAIDDVSGLALLQAGMEGPAIEAALGAHGLTLRHYPQSFEFSTLGGWIATRAGGHFATLYTHIDDLVAGTRMLTPAGAFETRPLPGSGAGPSPDRLVLGSEGAFGVITEAWVRVRSRPRWRAQVAVQFAAFEAAVAATRALARSGLHPSNCRLLDAREAMLSGVAMHGQHVLLIAFESADHPLDAWMHRAMELVADHGGVSAKGPRFRDGTGGGGNAGDADGDAVSGWRGAFIDAPYLQSTMISLGVIADTFETACSWAAFPELHRAVTQAVRGVMKAACGGGYLGCRFTHVYPDGPAPYYTFVAPGRRGGEREQWHAIKAAASDAILAHGGTITHHHAVGRVHRPWAERQWPALHTTALRAVKGAFDPAGVLNPGVLFGG